MVELPHASRWIFDMFMTTETLHQFVNLASNGPIAPKYLSLAKTRQTQEPVPLRALDYRSLITRGVDLPDTCLWPGGAGVGVTGVRWQSLALQLCAKRDLLVLPSFCLQFWF